VAVKSKSIEELERAASEARSALAASEAALVELSALSEPTADLALEERRVGELAIKRGAMERVIIAQRRIVEDAAAELLAAKGPVLRQQLAEVEAAANAQVAEAVALLWAAYHVTDNVRQVHNQSASILMQLGETGAGHARPPVQQMDEIRAQLGGLLESIGAGVRHAGMMGIELRPAPTAEERAARQEKQSKFRQTMEGARVAREKLRSIRDLGIDRYARQEVD
jgi:hypothetical protein